LNPTLGISAARRDGNRHNSRLESDNLMKSDIKVMKCDDLPLFQRKKKF
jgi:hypothetical protein